MNLFDNGLRYGIKEFKEWLVLQGWMNIAPLILRSLHQASLLPIRFRPR